MFTLIKKETYVYVFSAIIGLAILSTVSGCKANPFPMPPLATPDSRSDPATANLARIDPSQPVPDPGTAAGLANASEPQLHATTNPCIPALSVRHIRQHVAPSAEQSTLPPPSLPEVEQPPAPGPNALWTPGYWGYASTGYYWIPGIWVAAPYVGALWTPPYWGWDGSFYRFHRGYWGPHVGFYGGINYGFGYTGRGYEGGYWRDNNFYYNRAFNHINETNIYNVYIHEVAVHASRVSFNGGHGGINARPTFAELAAVGEHHIPATAPQIAEAYQFEQRRQVKAPVTGIRDSSRGMKMRSSQRYQQPNPSLSFRKPSLSNSSHQNLQRHQQFKVLPEADRMKLQSGVSHGRSHWGAEKRMR